MKYKEVETGSDYIYSIRSDELRCDTCNKVVLKFNHRTENKGYEIFDEKAVIYCGECNEYLRNGVIRNET